MSVVADHAVPSPVPPDDPDAWYAPAVRSQYEVHGGVVVQERAGETVVVAVAFDVRVSTPDGTTRFARTVRPR
ncbi:DUF7261 family protein [Halobacterium hubeiense]|uniref:DUF7261 family protein n=1 Tax=Halobacterium hubeiense TaxID=1407499 RepID=UPI003C75E5B9